MMIIVACTTIVIFLMVEIWKRNRPFPDVKVSLPRYKMCFFSCHYRSLDTVKLHTNVTDTGQEDLLFTVTSLLKRNRTVLVTCALWPFNNHTRTVLCVIITVHVLYTRHIHVIHVPCRKQIQEVGATLTSMRSILVKTCLAFGNKPLGIALAFLIRPPSANFRHISFALPRKPLTTLVLII